MECGISSLLRQSRRSRKSSYYFMFVVTFHQRADGNTKNVAARALSNVGIVSRCSLCISRAWISARSLAARFRPRHGDPNTEHRYSPRAVTCCDEATTLARHDGPIFCLFKQLRWWRVDWVDMGGGGGAGGICKVTTHATKVSLCTPGILVRLF